MKKILMTFIMIFSVVLLASCSNVTQSYADKINTAAENKEYYAYADVLEDLGDEAIDMTFLKTGIVVAVKGVTSEEELKAKIETVTPNINIPKLIHNAGGKFDVAFAKNTSVNKLIGKIYLLS